MLDRLAQLLNTLLGKPEQEELAERAFADHRRATRRRLRLPLKTWVLGMRVDLGPTSYSQAFSGYTRDISVIGLASVLPGAELGGLDLTGEYRRLRVVLELPRKPVEMFVTAVHHRQLYLGPEKGWLVGARITKISHDDHDLFLSHLERIG